MVLFVFLPRVCCFHGRALSALGLIRQVRSRHLRNHGLTIVSSLQQKHSQFDPKARLQSLQESEPLESIKPDNARLSEGERKNSLLAEHNVSNKEQRKADWAIMKEMSRYLWPKVGRQAARPSSQCLTTYVG